MSNNFNKTIVDLYVIANLSDSENAEKIYEIIERLQGFDERDDEQNNIYLEILRS
jgi:hypothetical protein